MQIRKYESLDEIRGVAGYIERVRKVETRNPKLLGYYEFKDSVHCSRAECNKPHKHGYVIETSEGEVIAIGNKCGARIFGKEIWNSAHSSFKKQIARHQLRASLTLQLAELPSVIEKVERLVYGPFGTVWLETAQRSLFALCSTSIMKQLDFRIAHRQEEILESKKVDGENALRLGFKRDSEFEHIVIGRLEGIRALALPTPHSVLVDKLLSPLRAYRDCSVEELLSRASMLRHFQATQNSVPERIKNAERRLAEARQFFRTENLRQLALLAKSGKDRDQMSRLRWDESTGLVEIERLAA